MENDTDMTMSISEQAAHWWVVFNDETASSSDHREFGRWVTGGPERVAAYLRVARLQRALRRPGVIWPAVSPEQLIREAKAKPEDIVPMRPVPRVASSARQRRPWFAVPRFAPGFAAGALV